MRTGFTLVELSIVLVIVGLIIGGIVVGQDLINAASIRAQMTQIQKYNAAVNTFRSKYGYLPGDMPETPANQYGLPARGIMTGTCPVPGWWDGNGIIQGNNSTPCSNPEDYSGVNQEGETTYFWMDLSAAALIDENFNSISSSTNYHALTGVAVNTYIPAAKIGNQNDIYVWSGGALGDDGINYFGLSNITDLRTGGNYITSVPGLSVEQAYDIDVKMDDGLPQSGKVVALYLNFNSNDVNPQWAGTSYQGVAPYTTATTGSSTSCFDNDGISGPQQYSMEQGNGAGVNCTLSFQFQ